MILWVVRDRNGDCWLHESEPIDCIEGIWQPNDCRFYRVSPRLFPEVTYKNSPQKIEIKFI